MSGISKKLINSPEQCVDEALHGLVLTNTHLRLLKNCPRVVVRADLEQYKASKRVTLVCGGGSGHEPVFAGYVGEGCLSAAVAGNVFASPPASHVQQALRAVHSQAGTLLFIFNYTGDRLNFGLAVERAIADGLMTNDQIRVVVLGEDTAIRNPMKATGRRGLAGSILMLKIAGAMAENGSSLTEIADYIEHAQNEYGTIGLSLGSCSLPGQAPIFTVDADQAVLGLGVHGEPGVDNIKMSSSKELVDKMLKLLVNEHNPYNIHLEQDIKYAVMVNNLGSVTQLEMNVVVNNVMAWFEERNVEIERLYNGPFMTSLEMHGISISLMKLDAKRLQFLVPDQQLLNACLRAACLSLINRQQSLNELDKAAGDGDCGSTMKLGAEVIRKALIGERLDLANPSVALQQLSILWESNTGGTSGAIYGLLFSGAVPALRDTVDVSYADWCKALCMAIQSVKTYSLAQQGDRTLVCELATQSTINMKAGAGRASYVNQANLTQVDAGAEAVRVWFTAVVDVLIEHYNK